MASIVLSAMLLQATLTRPAMTTGSVSAVPASQPAVPAGGLTIKAPMMGIFYRAASPSSPPFVKEGDVIKPGQILCMIEAMKVFNEIKAEMSGTIVEVLVENQEAVEFNQPLFLIKP